MENVDNVDYTKMSSKGQVVVPKSIRDNLNLKSGELFMIFADQDTLILKKVKKPPESDIRKMFSRSNELARQRGLTEGDVEKAIKAVRDETRH